MDAIEEHKLLADILKMNKDKKPEEAAQNILNDGFIHIDRVEAYLAAINRGTHVNSV